MKRYTGQDTNLGPSICLADSRIIRSSQRLSKKKETLSRVTHRGGPFSIKPIPTDGREIGRMGSLICLRFQLLAILFRAIQTCVSANLYQYLYHDMSMRNEYTYPVNRKDVYLLKTFLLRRLYKTATLLLVEHGLAVFLQSEKKCSYSF